MSQFPKPVIKGDQITIFISKEQDIAILNNANSLHGHMIFPKGTKSLKVEEIHG